MSDHQTTISAFPAPIVCWPWHLRLEGPADYSAGMECTDCRRDVAAPKNARRPICLYCAMERGLVPLIEIAPGSDRSPFPWLHPETLIDLDDLTSALS